MSVATCPTLIGEALWFVSLEGYGNWSATVRSVTLATGVRGAAVPRNALAQGWAVSDSSPAAAGGLLYFADYAGLLHQFNAANRRPLRALVLEGQTLSSPAISDGRLYLGLTTGKLLCLN
jgi:outer membrane protein assembly factor BamB